MHLNLRTLLAVAATTLLILPSVCSIPLDNPDDIALTKRNNALRTDTGVLSKANEVYSIVNLPQAPAVAPKLRPKPKPKPEDGLDVPKGPVKLDNPAIGDPKGTKCQRYLQTRCSDEEDKGDDEVPDEDVDKGYPSYLEYGNTRVDNMNAKMDIIRADPGGNHDKPRTVVNKKSYIIKDSSFMLGEDLDSAERVFDDLGLNKVGIDIKGYKAYATDGKTQKLVGENYVTSGDDPVIIAKWNNMQSQNIALPPNHIKRWSDLTYSALATVRGKLFEDIKFIIRDGINNEGTKNVIKKVHAELPNNVENGKGTFDLASQNAAEVVAAKALIGTPNGGGIYFVIDFPKAFGNQKVVRIHTWDYDKNWAMALELGPM